MLYFSGYGYRDAIGVDDGIWLVAFWLQPDEMLMFFGKTEDLRFNAGTVSRPLNAFSYVNTLMQIGTDDCVSGFVGVSGPASQLFCFAYVSPGVEVGEWLRR